ncbi:MAG: LPS-assembly protein LptD [Pseudomonadota bacterium]
MKRTPLLLLALAGPAIAIAADDGRWALCPPVPDLRSAALPAPTPLSAGATRLSADELFSQADGVTRLLGGVTIERDGATLLGEQAVYDRNSEQLRIEGEVGLRRGGLRIDGSRAQMNLATEEGEFSQTRFFLPDSHAFGSAERIELRGPEQAFLQGLSYTTCDPERPDWLLKASRLELDQASNTGEAWHARLAFKGVPFFYSPYLNFPLEGRKSGLLPPTIGSSDEGGDDIALPIYWNIAPNHDATLTPRHITRRGTMLSGEYRYLGKSSRGQLNASQLSDDQRYGDDRNHLGLSHQARFGDGWQSRLDYQRVSDTDYLLDDLGGEQLSGTQSHLERRADLRYSDRHWRFLARLQDYQTLSGTAPYQRLPQLRLDGATAAHRNRPRLELESEAVRFRHATRTPSGDRLDLKPALSLPLAGPAWFLTPKLAWRHTQYRLSDHPAGEQLERSLPIASLDSGLFFERDLTLAGKGYLQTLEPRLFYLHTPYESQDELPLFDTGERDFSFGQMFQDNRFSGADRQGDAEHIALALTSRLLTSQSGRERLRASIGQIRYLEDRRVTLRESEPVREQASSDIIAELALRPSDALSFSVTEQWNPHDDRAERLNARLRYNPAARKVLNMAYRYRREQALHQADIALLWPLSRQWRLIARYHYDMENELPLDTLGGLEYESCCWSVQVVARAQRDNIDQEANRSIQLTLQLKGLASLGRNIEQSLGHGILGN